MALSRTLVFKVQRDLPKMVQALGGNLASTSPEIKQLSDSDNAKHMRILIPFIFFYPRAAGVAKTKDPATAISDGLAKTLVAYYPLAGRLFEGPSNRLMVNCNNEGVAFTEADAYITLEQLWDGILPPCPHIKDFLPQIDGTPILNSPILHFQVTRFLCGGFSLGILFSHVLLDGAGFMQFLNALGEIMNGASTPSIPPIWQRELLNARSPPTVTSTHDEFIHSVSNIQQLSNDNYVRTSVFFNPKDIQALRDQISTPASRFDLITACLWKCCTMVHEPPSNDTVRVIIAMNARSRKGIDIPEGYYGNAVVTTSIVSKATSLCESPLAYAVNLVQQAKAQMSAEHLRSYVDFQATKGLLSLDRRTNLVVSDLTRFGFDKLDLGWGNPLFGGIPLAYPEASWYNNFKNEKGEDGVVVTICLQALKVDKFQCELHKMTHA